VAGLNARHVLVTGAGGFIGRALVDRLVAEGATVHVLTREHPIAASPAVRSIVAPLEQLTPAHWERSGVGAFDTVFHLGAFIPKTRHDADVIDANIVSNVVGTRCLLQSFATPPKRFVFASTIDVYAPMAPNTRLDEQSALAAAGLYACTKLCGERMIAAWGAQSSVQIAILRYGHVYGPGEGAYQKLIPQTIRTVLAGRNPVVYGDGSPERDCIYISDVVEATVRCAVRENVPADPVNIVSGVSHPIVDIVRHVIEAAGSAATIERVPAQGPDRSFRFDNTAMRTHLGTWPLTTLDEGLRAEVEYVRSGR
jgi:UDP-glucose 4-epimerase